MGAVGMVAVYYDWQHIGGYDHGIAVPAIAVGAAYFATVLLSRLKSG